MREIAYKYIELIKTLSQIKIEFAAITETKKKQKESKRIQDYKMLYSKVKHEVKASKGVALY